MSEGQAIFYLFVASVPYAGLVALFRWQLPGHRITPFFVVGGNLLIIAAAFPIIGTDNAIFLFKLNAVAAVGVCVEYYVSAWCAERRKRQRRQERDF